MREHAAPETPPAQPRPQPPVRDFLARYGVPHGLTTEVLAGQLRLPLTECARHLESHCPPKWFVLAVAGVGTARGIPVEELRSLLNVMEE